MRYFESYWHPVVRLFLIICLCLVLGYSIRGLWIKGIIIEKKARALSDFLDQSFSRLGLRPEDISRHFYEERRVGVKKFVHTTKIFNLPQNISGDSFYQAVLDAVKNSGTNLLEKTSFDAGDYSVSIFILGRRPISTHLLVGIKKEAKQGKPGSEKARDVKKESMKKIGAKDKVAIIIDDLGYNTKALDYISWIKVPLTLAILPELPFSGELAAKGHNMGHEIILHLPLEPEQEIEALGPGAIFLNMTPQEIGNILDADLKSVPYCKGISNHTGSRFTRDIEKMRTLLAILKKKNLFFVDSLVIPESIGYELACEIGVPSAERDIFLDNIKKKEEILNQLNALIEISRKTGKAIGIGHPSPVTFEVLNENLYHFEDVEFVHVSELLK